MNASFWMPGSESYKWDPAMTSNLAQSAQGLGGPSAAQSLAQRLFDRAMRQTMGMVASNRGVPAAAGLRQGLQAQSGLQSDAAGQASMLRAQEQQQAIANWLQQQQAAQQGYYQNAQLNQMADAQNSNMLWKLLGGLLGAGGSLASQGIGSLMG